MKERQMRCLQYGAAALACLVTWGISSPAAHAQVDQKPASSAVAVKTDSDWTHLTVTLSDGRQLSWARAELAKVEMERRAPVDPSKFSAAGLTWVTKDDANHFFRSEGSGDWVESSGGKIVFRFKERSKTPQFVEIHDSARQVTVRLQADKYAWSTNMKDWTTGSTGRWK
jgi:hypothetical protein